MLSRPSWLTHETQQPSLQSDPPCAGQTRKRHVQAPSQNYLPGILTCNIIDGSLSAILRSRSCCLQRLHLIRQDGTPWSSVLNAVATQKLLSCIERRARDAVSKYKMARWEGPRVIWEDWADGFLSPTWDGASFDEEYGRELLQGGQEGTPATRTTLPAEVPTSEVPTSEAAPDDGHVASWLSNLPAASISPHDSVTYIGQPRCPTRRPPGPPAFAQQPVTEVCPSKANSLSNLPDMSFTIGDRRPGGCGRRI